ATARRPYLQPRSHLALPRAVLGPFLTRNAGPGGPTHESAGYQKRRLYRNGGVVAAAPMAWSRHVSCAPNARPVRRLRRGLPSLRGEASSPKLLRRSFDGREACWAVFVDRDRVLEVGGQGAVGRVDRPAVRLD